MTRAPHQDGAESGRSPANFAYQFIHGTICDFLSVLGMASAADQLATPAVVHRTHSKIELGLTTIGCISQLYYREMALWS
jgi:hypothetical protein